MVSNIGLISMHRQLNGRSKRSPSPHSPPLSNKFSQNMARIGRHRRTQLWQRDRGQRLRLRQQIGIRGRTMPSVIFCVPWCNASKREWLHLLFFEPCERVGTHPVCQCCAPRGAVLQFAHLQCLRYNATTRLISCVTSSTITCPTTVIRLCAQSIRFVQRYAATCLPCHHSDTMCVVPQNIYGHFR